jgi:hypothetical protein
MKYFSAAIIGIQLVAYVAKFDTTFAIYESATVNFLNPCFALRAFFIV